MLLYLKGGSFASPPPSSNKVRRRKDARNEMRTDVLDYVGFGTMQLGFTIFAKLFHFVQFSLLWSFLRKLIRRPLTAANKSKTEPFWICFTHGCNAFFLTIRRSQRRIRFHRRKKQKT